MSITIGNFNFKYGLFLAPMAGITDKAFREICRQYGAEYTVTEMVSAKALCFNDSESQNMARIEDSELPSAVQIFGHEPDIISVAIKKITEKINSESKPTAIDINMGCPMRKIVSNGDGAALMKNPELAGRIVKAAALASSVPITVKFRTGWSEETKNAVDFAKIVEYNGASMICVHGRTREGMYTPPVDLKTIAEVKRSVKIPVIANGGVFTADGALEMLEKTKCDGIMIARGAMGNPWIFEEIKSKIDGRDYFAPSIKERIGVALKQTEKMAEYKGEHIALLEARRQISYYIKGEVGSAEARGRLNTSTSFDEINEIIEDFLDKQK